MAPFLVQSADKEISPLRKAISGLHFADEAGQVRLLADSLSFSPEARARIEERARQIITYLRAHRHRIGSIDALMQEYDLSSDEGVTLMCLAEALLRIPDTETQDRFIEEKLGLGDWAAHLGASDSFFVNASTFGMMMAGKTLSIDEGAGSLIDRLIKRLGEPIIRDAVRRAMTVLGHQFVMGRTIEAAVARAQSAEKNRVLHSYDMLGEAAYTEADALGYFEAYAHAIEHVGSLSTGDPATGPGISVKLSALHPRYDYLQKERTEEAMKDRLNALCALAAAHGIGLTVDAEEADRLDFSLDLIEAVATDANLKNWEGLGVAVQAYQKRAPGVIDWLSDLASRTNRRVVVRLVKGAYWDSEIKRAQERGLEDFPVFTRKCNTDISFAACARKLLEAGGRLYPCFATHNALSVATVLELAGSRTDFEFQRLHGMGEALYRCLGETFAHKYACRVYAPVGGHQELLAYLVRRLLENGANTSFVHRLSDDALPLADIVQDPVEISARSGFSGSGRIVRPRELFGPGRVNSEGIELSDRETVRSVKAAFDAADRRDWSAAPIVGGDVISGAAQPCLNPANRSQVIGHAVWASPQDAARALDIASGAAAQWRAVPAAERAAILRRASDLLEQRKALVACLVVREAGRIVPDALAEVREAVDFLRYYAAQAELLFTEAGDPGGPAGEENRFSLLGRGPFLAISPWNFSVAIFTGQIAAALAAGCPVLAKPAEQTPLVGARMISLLHEAGVPVQVLHFLPGDGPSIGAAVVGDARLGGVVFTGSFETAQILNRQLAARDGPIIPLIAETGGINAMIVDSTALPEQVTRDVVRGAFNSAGQRCSSLRLLCLQDSIADAQLDMIAGAMATLEVGDPAFLSSDVGPIIDGDALDKLVRYRKDVLGRARKIAECERGTACPEGLFFPPLAVELTAARALDREVFGPVLHVVRYGADAVDRLTADINATGYGLTFSVHSRRENFIRHVLSRVRAGNCYVNRDQINAIVGLQPFGGEGLSGTGPKAGGPHYLQRFVIERSVSDNKTALGGNATLLAQLD